MAALLTSLIVLGGCAQPPANQGVRATSTAPVARMREVPIGAALLQQLPWSGGVAEVLRMPNGTSRILFSTAVGVDLGFAGEPQIERVDQMVNGTLFLVRASGPGCAHGYRLFRVNGSQVAGWALQVCRDQKNLYDDGELEVTTSGADSWEAIQRDHREKKIREKIIDWRAADPGHLSYHERLVTPASSTPARKVVATGAMATRAASSAAASTTTAAHVTRAPQAGNSSAPLPAKVPVGAGQAAPLEVNLDGSASH